jgi:hypothetical protein
MKVEGENMMKGGMFVKKRGLCNTCTNDKTCTFPRRFPVIQCEEFTGYEPRPTKARISRLEKMHFDEEPTVWE